MIMSEKILEVKHLGKAFGSNQVLRDIDFSVSPGAVSYTHLDVYKRQGYPVDFPVAYSTG